MFVELGVGSLMFDEVGDGFGRKMDLGKVFRKTERLSVGA